MVVGLIVLELIVLTLHNLRTEYNARSRSLKIFDGPADITVFMYISLGPVSSQRWALPLPCLMPV